ncbi:MAG: AAA family ATPase [Comamonas sp.]|nr:AAA family ATPase [Comamonas sp.]
MYDDAQAAALVQQLGQQLAPAGDFRIVQTHLSRVLLLPDRVLKFKRPVRLPFANFTALQDRAHFCAEELRLNQRLAPDLYLAVLPVGGSVAQPVLGAEPALDWALHMRRFAADQELTALVAHNDLPLAQVQDFGTQLAAFHHSAPRAAPDAPWGQAAQVESAIGQVLQTLASVAPAPWAHTVAALQDWWHSTAPRMRPLWAQRQAAGQICEGHGDLHLGNVVRWQGCITAFDCIEFEPAFRWLDPMADIGFFTMDLKLRGHADLAWGFLDAYLSASGDYAGLAVLQVYEVYRALVRAMAAALSGSTEQVPNYAQGALDLAQPRAPQLLLTHGRSGSGKSTVALALLQAAGAVRVRSDVERKRLAGLPALANSAAQGLQIYHATHTARTWQHLHQLTAQLLRSAYAPVIVDAAFLQASQRQAFAELAAQCQVPCTILHCHAPDAQLHTRLTQRQAQGDDPSEADVQVLAGQRAEPLSAQELAYTLDCPTDQPWNAQALARHWLQRSK